MPKTCDFKFVYNTTKYININNAKIKMFTTTNYKSSIIKFIMYKMVMQFKNKKKNYCIRVQLQAILTIFI